MGRALPAHHVSQGVLLDAFRAAWGTAHHNLARLEQLHRAVGVGGRYLALPLAAYADLTDFQKSNDAWIRAAERLGEAALADALERAGLRPRDLDHLLFVSVTGVATPSIDARLVNRMGLRRDLKRTPIFGLGCVAGAAGIARARDTLRGGPGEVAALLSVELCSLTLQRGDLSMANIIASGLFGDGAAAVILGGAERARRGPHVVASRSVFYPDTERVMGWDVTGRGFKVVLSAAVPELVQTHLRGDVDAFLRAHHLALAQIRHFICHPGGPKVLTAFEQALGQPRAAFQRTWDSLERVGNLSSASVLFVLGDTLDAQVAAPGDLGLLVAMGPGFCAELVLLQW